MEKRFFGMTQEEFWKWWHENLPAIRAYFEQQPWYQRLEREDAERVDGDPEPEEFPVQ